MFKKTLFSLAVAAMVAAPFVGNGAVNATHVLMNGGTNATVDKGDTVETRVTYTATASEDIESMSVEDIGSGIPAVCVDVPDQITTGTYHVILNDWPTVDGRNIDAPSFAGSWNRRVRLYGVDGSGADQQCTGAVRDTINSAGQLTVRQDPTPLNPTPTPIVVPTATPTPTPTPTATPFPTWFCQAFPQFCTNPVPPTGGGTADIHLSMDLHVGSHGSDVVALQSYLIGLGYSIPAGPTGNFYGQTFNAVRSFQSRNGIPTTGYVGPLTRGVINAGTGR